MKQKHFATLFNCCFHIACATGLFYQVRGISGYYFEYQTITELTMDIPERLRPPDLSTCFQFTQILDFARLASDRHLTINVKDDDAITKLLRNITLVDVFKYVPDKSRVTTNCVVRPNSSYTFSIFHTPTECNERLEIDMFYMQNFVCYRLHWSESNLKQMHSHLKLAFSLDYSGTIYATWLHGEYFKNVKFMKLILHTGWPTSSSAFADPFMRLNYSKFYLHEYHDDTSA